MTSGYILEHPTRGTFRELDSDWRAGKRIDIPRFSVTGRRDDPDRAQRFGSVTEAREMRDRIARSDARVAARLFVLRIRDFKQLCNECRSWTTDNRWHEHLKSCSVYRDEVARHSR